MTSETPILSETRTGYRVITLNRPDKLNAFNEAMHQALRKAIEDAEADEGCRALLITGAGRGFCTGQDLSDRLAKPGETVVLGGNGQGSFTLTGDGTHVITASDPGNQISQVVNGRRRAGDALVILRAGHPAAWQSFSCRTHLVGRKFF